MLVFCSLFVQSQIVGIVNYHENPSNPLPSVTLDLFDSNNNLVATTLSNSIGEFSFTNIPSGDYSLVSSTSLPVGEVDLMDASLILQYLIGWYTFNDCEFAAADVNGSGNVTFSDYMIVIISYIMQGNPFPTDDWQFDEITVSVSNSRDSTEHANVWGISTGDVEGVWQPGGRDIDLISSEDQDLTLLNDHEIELTIGSDYSSIINGFNLNMVYPVNLIEITEVTGPDENFHYELDANSGILKVIWLDENENSGEKFSGETLFRVKVKQLDMTISEEEGLFSLLDGGMVLDSRSNKIEDLQITLPKIAIQSSNIKLNAISYPNPVIDQLNLEISSPVDGKITIYVFDLSGRLIQEVNNTSIVKGTQVMSIGTSDLPSGQYLYKINIGNKNLHGRFQK